MWIAAGAFLAIVVIVSLGYYRWKRRKVIAMLAKMNGPPSLPLLGHTHMINVFGSGGELTKPQLSGKLQVEERTVKQVKLSEKM